MRLPCSKPPWQGELYTLVTNRRVVAQLEFLPTCEGPSSRHQQSLLPTRSGVPSPRRGGGLGRGGFWEPALWASGGERCSPRLPSPSPQPSPTRGEGEKAIFPHTKSANTVIKTYNSLGKGGWGVAAQDMQVGLAAGVIRLPQRAGGAGGQAPCGRKGDCGAGVFAEERRITLRESDLRVCRADTGSHGAWFPRRSNCVKLLCVEHPPGGCALCQPTLRSTATP